VNFASPSIELVDLGGKQASLADYRGRIVLVNNWATWCPPCRAEMPTLEAYYQDHKEQNFSLIGIEAGDPDGEVAQFVKQYGLSFSVWLDPENKALSGFQNNSLPSSYVIDEDGTVILAWTGAISREMLEKYVTPLLKD
jgi:thiol-disulfide isomerase/thioredoxin